MKYFKIILSLIVLFLCYGISWAQNGDGAGRFHSEPYSLVIGPYDGVSNGQIEISEADAGYRAAVTNYQLITEQVSAQDASWIRLKFANVNLGDNSFITLTSDADGGIQKLNWEHMAIWNNGSAIFNGNSVTMTLHIASSDNNIGLSVSELVVGEANPNAPVPETQCGTADNRVNSSTGAIGRISPVGCTGWLIANGSFLTAGHCTGTSMDILEFNVPPSTSDGFTVASNPNDQYPIGSVTFDLGAAGNGNDWAVFSVGVNSNTGLTPNEQQGSFNTFDQIFFRATKDNSATTNRITGFGIDFVPAGSGGNGNRNSDSQTQQTATGGAFSETGTGTAVGINYAIDTEGGNSGSPVIMNGTINTVGIHTNGGCATTTPNGTNSGTGFEEDDLETAIDDFNGSADRYVDEGHPSAIAATGSVMRPHKTVNSAITAAAAGTTLYIAEGGYPETIVTSKTLVFKAPVGLVVIGPNAPASPQSPLPQEAKLDETIVQNNISKSSWNAYPNPFITRLHIKNDEFEKGDVYITVYNLLNQRVAVLSNYENLEGSRFYENFDLSYLSKGIYALVVEHNGKQTISKITKAE